ncbi:putative Protein disulfide-isomerase [Blattamonas nauphoetae]|uniref:Thioredoxin domain-containing protein n=1 Tax=Blattamonas nauphoetae TaxID=2049346 RepID=A0ABQ9XWL2_9EUKA|nr:putative Protein disulfide-isomerase [Blattamonas nauphoetae]
MILLLLFDFLIQSTFCKPFQLNSENFEETINSNNVFCKFYGSSDKKSKESAPMYDGFADRMENFKENVLIAEMDCSKNFGLCNRIIVKKYPFFKYFERGNNESIEYEGPETPESFAEFLTFYTGSYSRKQHRTFRQFTADDLHDTVMDPNLNVFVAFTADWCGHCAPIPRIFEQTAAAFEEEDHVVFGWIDADKARKRTEAYDLNGFPSFRWFPSLLTLPEIQQLEIERAEEQAERAVKIRELREQINAKGKSEDEKTEEDRIEEMKLTELVEEQLDSMTDPLLDAEPQPYPDNKHEKVRTKHGIRIEEYHSERTAKAFGRWVSEHLNVSRNVRTPQEEEDEDACPEPPNQGSGKKKKKEKRKMCVDPLVAELRKRRRSKDGTGDGWIGNVDFYFGKTKNIRDPLREPILKWRRTIRGEKVTETIEVDDETDDDEDNEEKEGKEKKTHTETIELTYTDTRAEVYRVINATKHKLVANKMKEHLRWAESLLFDQMCAETEGECLKPSAVMTEAELMEWEPEDDEELTDDLELYLKKNPKSEKDRLDAMVKEKERLERISLHRGMSDINLTAILLRRNTLSLFLDDL